MNTDSTALNLGNSMAQVDASHRNHAGLTYLWTAVLLILWSTNGPAGLTAQTPAETPLLREPGVAFRVLSWNVSHENLFRYSDHFRSVLRLADPDILLLDEVPGGRSAEEVAWVLRGLRGETDTNWNVVIGVAGGRQRGAIGSRSPVEPVPELGGMKYPDRDVARLKSLVPDSLWNSRVKASLDGGIPTVGAVVRSGGRTVLAVSVDLQCCNSTNGWEEVRRQIEAKEIRSAIQRVLEKRSVDAVIIGGDLNLVSGATPLVVLTNPYPPPHSALVPAEAVHLDGNEVWTWDGRDSPFPSGVLDFSLYSPASLVPVRAVVLSTEDLSSEMLAARGLGSGTSRKLSDHLPIIVDYLWRTRRSTE